VETTRHTLVSILFLAIGPGRVMMLWTASPPAR